MLTRFKILLCTIGQISISFSLNAAEIMTLQEAEIRALKHDLLIQKYRHSSDALRYQAEAAGTWPDPKIKIGFMSLPTDTYSVGQIDMTQEIIGLKQSFPPWGKVKHMKKKYLAKSHAMLEHVQIRELQVSKLVRLSWLNISHAHQALKIIQKNKKAFRQLFKTTQLHYRSGRRQQHEVFGAQLELYLMLDLETQMRQAKELAAENLFKWLVDVTTTDLNIAVTMDLDMQYHDFPELPNRNEIESNLQNHPEITAAKALLKAAQEDVKIATTEYIPKWGFDLMYGSREGSRSDLLSAIITLDIPVFPKNRQGKNVASNKSRLAAAQYELEDRLRNLLTLLNIEYTNWRQLNIRLQHYQKQVVPAATNHAEAALKEYESGVVDFNIVVRAELALLKTNLGELEIRTKRTKAHIKLLYIAGDLAL